MAQKLYDPKYCNMLIDHGKKGLDFESFAAEIGVSRQTIYDWEKKHVEFEEAKELAMNHRRLLIQKLLIGQSSGKVKGAAPSLIYTAKNILGWKDVITQEVSQDSGDLNINLNYSLTQPPEKKDDKGE